MCGRIEQAAAAASAERPLSGPWNDFADRSDRLCSASDICRRICLGHAVEKLGVQPAAVLGHSVGEVVAACVAGVLSLSDALKLIAARGRLMQSCPPGGGMLAVFATHDQVEKLLATHNGVEIAAINGSTHIVLSGRKAALDAIALALELAGIKSKVLVVSHAFHSALMDPILTEFESNSSL